MCLSTRYQWVYILCMDIYQYLHLETCSWLGRERANSLRAKSVVILSSTDTVLRVEYHSSPASHMTWRLQWSLTIEGMWIYHDASWKQDFDKIVITRSAQSDLIYKISPKNCILIGNIPLMEHDNVCLVEHTGTPDCSQVCHQALKNATHHGEWDRQTVAFTHPKTSELLYLAIKHFW